MADTKLKGKLPDGDANGLKGDAWRKRLVAEPLRPHVAIVIFDAPTTSKNYEQAIEVPSARLLAFEPIEGPAAEALIEQLRRSAEIRTSKTTLDIPEEETEPPAPKELSASVEYFFLVRKGVAGRFTLVLATGTGAELAKRGNLLVKEHEGIDDAPELPLKLEQLPESLATIGRILIDEHEGVEDAEIVEDEPEAGDDQ